MPIKINSFGGILIWYLRKNKSYYTSKVALEYADKKYRKIIQKYIQEFHSAKSIPLFKMVNIETINRCNGTCAFCPSNISTEKREYKKMPASIFEKIINDLKEMEWGGTIFLNVNNEPLLDTQIVERANYIKAHLGNKVRVSMFTNGTILSIEKLKALACCVDELIINNYSLYYRLSAQNIEIYQYVKRNPLEFKNINIRINRRYSQEILATRAGNAPNKQKRNNKVIAPCIYPYTDITIFPDGKVGLCCNDCYEITNYGNVNNESLKNIWGNEQFRTVRNFMVKGRLNFHFCRECDVVDTGFRERLIKETNRQKRRYEK